MLFDFLKLDQSRWSYFSVLTTRLFITEEIIKACLEDPNHVQKPHFAH